METDCTERMCRARLARNRESNWANEFLGRALSCNYTLTCLTILLPLNPAALRLYLPTATALHRPNAPETLHKCPQKFGRGEGWKKNCFIFKLCAGLFIYYYSPFCVFFFPDFSVVGIASALELFDKVRYENESHFVALTSGV